MMTALTPDRLLRRIRTRTGGGIVTISTYDVGPADEGRHRIGYVCERDHTEIFRGTDVEIPAGQAIDSDRTLAAVIGFLSLQPGDTDPEYFDDYTPDQAAFADTCAAELALVGDTLSSDFALRNRTTGTGEPPTIGATRAVLERMRADAGELARDLETLQAHLTTAELDQATLGEIADVLDAALICRASATTALVGLNARHAAIEEALNTTPHPAKTSFYRH